MDFLFACRIQRRLEVTILQKQTQLESQAGGGKPVVNGFGGRMGKPLQDVVTGDIGVVVAENREHYIYITEVLPANWKKTERRSLQVSTCCSMWRAANCSADAACLIPHLPGLPL